mmetsp:Transcript_88314/g.142882  ORF Transcript_88314/g.142882 Transcript_88314/m.142882 type:complete len:230 (-) Transcript_88314:518-1207(-)
MCAFVPACAHRNRHQLRVATFHLLRVYQRRPARVVPLPAHQLCIGAMHKVDARVYRRKRERHGLRFRDAHCASTDRPPFGVVHVHTAITTAAANNAPAPVDRVNWRGGSGNEALHAGGPRRRGTHTQVPERHTLVFSHSNQPFRPRQQPLAASTEPRHTVGAIRRVECTYETASSHVIDPEASLPLPCHSNLSSIAIQSNPTPPALTVTKAWPLYASCVPGALARWPRA